MVSLPITEKDLFEFKGSLIYIASSRTARVISRDPDLKNKQQTNKKVEQSKYLRTRNITEP